MKKIAICINHYNNQQEVENFIRHIEDFRRKGIIIDVFVNDNSGAFGLNLGFVNIIPFKENLGYINGLITASSLASRKDDYDWYIFSNTDIKFDMNFMEILLRQSLDRCILAPNICTADGHMQNPFMRQRISKKKIDSLINISKRPLIFAAYMTFGIILKKIKNYLHGSVRAESKEVGDIDKIYAAHGSCFLISASALDILSNSFDIFIFGEEIYLAEMARKMKINILYVASLKVEHFEHSTTGKNPSVWRAKHLNKSLMTIKDKFFVK